MSGDVKLGRTSAASRTIPTGTKQKELTPQEIYYRLLNANCFFQDLNSNIVGRFIKEDCSGALYWDGDNKTVADVVCKFINENSSHLNDISRDDLSILGNDNKDTYYRVQAAQTFFCNLLNAYSNDFCETTDGNGIYFGKKKPEQLINEEFNDFTYNRLPEEDLNLFRTIALKLFNLS